MNVDIGILGPLTVRSSGGEAAPTAHKPRQLLALLAACAGRSVSVDHLVDELWEDNPPASAVTTVQTYIVQLRRSLAKALQVGVTEVANGSLPFTGWGYCLNADRASLETAEFAQYAEQGRRCLVKGENEQAAALLRRALRVWRGPALADIRVGPQLLAHRIRLEENRLGVVEQRVEADLRLGRHHELLGELAGLAVKYPLHENIHSLFIISLYRSGRAAQALEACRILQRSLRDELGIDPSARIKNLRDSIIVADPALESENRSKLFLMELGNPTTRAAA